MTWDHVHAGDTVRGADGRAWEVTGRTPGPRWVAAGAHDKFTLALGEREVTTTRKLVEPAPIAERADHSAEAHAWQVLHDNGFQLSLIGEERMTATATADPFSAPATSGDGIKRDRYKRYLLPHPETGRETAFTRVTTLARTIADMYGLHQWDKRNVAKGMGLRPDLVVGAAAADPDEDKATLTSIVEQAEAAAGAKKGANLGTAFHQAAQRLDRGEALKSIGMPPPLDVDLANYAAELRRQGCAVIPEYIERTVYVPLFGFEVVGTLDRILSQPPGVTKSEPLTIGDLKSGKDLDYSWLEIEIQQACYSRAKFMWNRAQQCWEPMPPVDQARALIIHSPIGKGCTQIYGVNLIEGWRKAKLALDVREARKSAKGWLVQPQDPRALVWHLVSNAGSQAELAQLWEMYHPKGLWVEEIHAAAQTRLAQLQATTA